MWTYDVAREQSPSLEMLLHLAQLTRDAGYNALGLYLEHRFAYESAPWIAGKGAVTPEMIRTVRQQFPDLELIPFMNLLGHMEGTLYASGGEKFAAERFRGLSADPRHPEFATFCAGLMTDIQRAFEPRIIHLGGDETSQLGLGPYSEPWIREVQESNPNVDAKAILYGEHVGALARLAQEKGMTPALWGDMFYEHPSALEAIPPETILFDWQYFRTAEFTAQRFRDRGFRVVLCPALQTYSALWCHLPQSERNIQEHASAAARHGDHGVCVTTWELGLFGNLETLLPAIQGAGRILNDPDPTLGSEGARELPLDGLGGPEAIRQYRSVSAAPVLTHEYEALGENAREWAIAVGCELQSAGELFAYSGHRSQIKCRLLLYGNPFLLWLRDRETLLGTSGQRAYQVLDRSIILAPNSAYRGINEFGKLAIDFVRATERAAEAYAREEVGAAATELMVGRQVFENLERIAKGTALRAGGSMADIERCRIARTHVETVIRRIKQYGDGSLGYRPSFETITHPKFVPHDQANWWLINSWGNE